jgi:hypothetical protein
MQGIRTKRITAFRFSLQPWQEEAENVAEKQRRTRPCAHQMKANSFFHNGLRAMLPRSNICCVKTARLVSVDPSGRGDGRTTHAAALARPSRLEGLWPSHRPLLAAQKVEPAQQPGEVLSRAVDGGKTFSRGDLLDAVHELNPFDHLRQ